MNLLKKDFKINSIFLINLVFAFFPISFILGNFATNLNLVLLCFLGIFQLKSKILKIKFNLTLKIIFLIFFIVFFSTGLNVLKSFYVNGYDYENLVRLIKSVAFFRYFLMLIIVYLLSEANILNFKYFFISAAVFSILIALDVIYQYTFGFNIIGLESHIHHNSSFFGDELIAGGFIQNFSFFSILFLSFKFKNKKILNNIYIIAVIGILGVGILLSGNRMALVLFMFGLLLIFLFGRELKKILTVSLISLIFIFGFIFSYDQSVKTNFVSYYGNLKYTVVKIFNLPISVMSSDDLQKKKIVDVKLAKESDKEKKFLDNDFEFFWVEGTEGNSYVKLFNTSIDTWKKNKIFGNGMKSFRIDCIKFQVHTKNRLCSNHPHNYYLEILTETGIVGFLLVMVVALLFLIFIFRNLSFLKGSNIENFILLAATTSLILEVFPFKNTGSIFTTNDATYITLLSSIILSSKAIAHLQNPNR